MAARGKRIAPTPGVRPDSLDPSLQARALELLSLCGRTLALVAEGDILADDKMVTDLEDTIVSFLGDDAVDAVCSVMLPLRKAGR